MNWDLDRTDFDILTILRQEGRMSNKELADRVDLAESTCLERVRQLEESGALKGVHAEVEGEAIGAELQALIAVQLDEHAREVVEDFRHHALGLEPAVSLYHVGGEHDFLLHVAVAGSDHLRNLVLDELTTRPEVAHVETWLIFEYEPTWELPDVGEFS